MVLKMWTNYYSGDQIEKNEIGVAFSKYAEMRDAYRVPVGNLSERDAWEEQDVDGRIIVK